jgi:DNA-binding MarR family transcriptional regulator
MDFFDALVKYETDLWNHLDDRLRAGRAVPLPTLFALRVVRRHAGTCRVHEIRSDLGITVGAASKLVDRLERDGLAVRRPHPDDRRSSLVSLTPEGDRAHDQGVELLRRGLDDQLGTDPRIPALTAELVRLQARLAAGADLRADAGAVVA